MDNVTLAGANAPAPINNVPVTVDVDQAVAEWRAYQEITRLILDESDSVLIKGNQYKKKSAWRKYAKAFNISTELLEKEIIKNDKDVVTEATFVVRATLPSGRFADGWGNCSRREKNRSHPNHDIPATAMTRATNRAIADLIGAGEVTAEEIQAEVDATARANAKAKVVKKPQPKPKKVDTTEPEFIDVEVVKDPEPFVKPVVTIDNAKEIADSTDS